MVTLSPDMSRFWNKVDYGDDSDSCWEWTAHRNRTGYGKVSYRGKARFAHRVSWELIRGPIPDGLYVCHRCDNPCCVRWSHLFLGTAADNNRDMHAKGRGFFAQGEEHPSAKYTAQRVRAVRCRRAEGASYGAIAAEFEMPRGAVIAMVNRRWQSLPSEEGQRLL